MYSGYFHVDKTTKLNEQDVADGTNKYNYYICEIFKNLTLLNEEIKKSNQEITNQIIILLNQIKDNNPGSKYYFLPLALATLKLKEAIIKKDDSLVNKITSFFQEKKETPDLKFIEKALSLIKAAITKFIVSRETDISINQFISSLSLNEKESFQNFWGYSFIERVITPTKASPHTAPIIAQQNSTKDFSSVVNSVDNSAIDEAVQNALKATEEMLKAIGQNAAIQYK